jgi:hypothetical protein
VLNSLPSTSLLGGLFKTYSDVLSHQYSLNDSGTGYSIQVCCFLGVIHNFSSVRGTNRFRTSLTCPHCTSRKLWRNGYRHTPFDDKIQRWLCCNRAHRFSDPQDVQNAWSTFEHIERVQSKSIKSGGDIMSDSQICVTETKNLAAEQTQKTTEVPRKTDLKSAIVNFLWHLKKANYSPDTIRAYRFNIQQLVRLGVDLYNPETFIETMANQTKLTQTRKYSLRKAYKSFLNANKIEAELPTFKITRPLPYIPPEEYLDQLIASSNTQMTTFLETLKQIGARPGEVWRLKWEDIDIAGKKSASANQKKAATQESAPSTPNS